MFCDWGWRVRQTPRGLRTRQGGVRGSAKGHNKKKKVPAPSFAAPHPNILFQIQFIIAFASRFEVRTSHMRSPTYSNALYKKAQVSQEALPSSIYKLLCFTPQWKPCEIPAQRTNGVTSDPAPAPATPTPSDSPCALWGLLSGVWIIGIGISPQERSIKKGWEKERASGEVHHG